MVNFDTTSQLLRLRGELRAHNLREVPACLILTGATASIGFEDAEGKFGYIMASRSTGLIPEFDRIDTEWFSGEGVPAVVRDGVLQEVRA